MTDTNKPPKPRRTWLPGEKNLQIRMRESLYQKIEDSALKSSRSRSAEAKQRLEQSFMKEKE